MSQIYSILVERLEKSKHLRVFITFSFIIHNFARVEMKAKNSIISSKNHIFRPRLGVPNISPIRLLPIYPEQMDRIQNIIGKAHCPKILIRFITFETGDCCSFLSSNLDLNGPKNCSYKRK